MDFRQELGLKNRDGEYVLIHTLYDRAKKESDGKYGKDKLTLVYKDIERDKLIKLELDEPKIEAYKAKPQFMPSFPELYMQEDYLERVDLTYGKRALEIAKLLGQDAVKYYYDLIKNGRYKDTDAFITHKSMFSSDVDIENFYRIRSLEEFGKINGTIPLTKGFLDIEVDFDGYDFDVENAKGDAPINVITYVDEASERVYTLILRDDRNPQIQELEDDIRNFIVELREEFATNKYFKNFKYGIKFYDDELELIESTFDIIHTLKPNFMMVWNLRFDMRYIINRLERLGVDPRTVINHKDFTSDTCYFKLDNKSDKLTMRSDDFVNASYSKWIDQMLVYAQVRKAKSIPSVKLDAIGEKEIGEGKISYGDTGTIKTLPKRNFRKFIMYNIKDTLIQCGIERKTKDIDFMFTKGYESGTKISKVFRETVYNRNLGYIYFKSQGMILGTNQNVGGMDSGVKKEKFEGAVVGEPELNDCVGIKILGKPSNSIIDDLQDQDVESMYPHIIITMNIDAKTQIGRVYLDTAKITLREIIDDAERYNRGGAFLDDLQIREPIQFMYRWHNMPDVNTLLDGFKDFDKQGSVKKLFTKKTVRNLFR